MNRKRMLRLPSFAKSTGDLFLVSSAVRVTQCLTHRILLKNFLARSSKVASLSPLTETRGDSGHFCLKLCNVFYMTRAISVMHASAAVTYVLSRGTTG